MIIYKRLSVFLLVILLLQGCTTNSDPIDNSPDEVDIRYLAGGETTIFNANSHAFSNPAPNLSEAKLDLHLEGDAAFEFEFVAAP
ncbi:MAG: di-heme oxidoredictase family protein, partial [Calditrichota bacterium]